MIHCIPFCKPVYTGLQKGMQWIIDSQVLNIRVLFRGVQGGIAKIPPLSGEAGPPIAAQSAAKFFLGFLREFSGKFRVFREI